MKRVLALVSNDKAQSSTEYAILTAAVIISMISTISLGGSALAKVGYGWFQNAVTNILIRVSSLADLTSAVTEFWRQ